MDFQEDSRSAKLVTLVEGWRSLNLTLVFYQSMLNIKMLGGEGIPFYAIVCFSMAK